MTFTKPTPNVHGVVMLIVWLFIIAALYAATMGLLSSLTTPPHNALMANTAYVVIFSYIAHYTAEKSYDEKSWRTLFKSSVIVIAVVSALYQTSIG